MAPLEIGAAAVLPWIAMSGTPELLWDNALILPISLALAPPDGIRLAAGS